MKPKFETFTLGQQKYLTYVKELLNDGNSHENVKILLESPTASGKTTIISYMSENILKKKTILISLSPSVVICEKIRRNQKEFGYESYSFSDFRQHMPLADIICISDTHSSINSEGAKIHTDGDTKGLIPLLQKYHQNGYTIIIQIDESGIFVNNEENETFKIITHLPPCLQLHYSATPDSNIQYNKTFLITNEEVEKTGRVKRKIQVNQLGHNDTYEMINDVLEHRENIEPYYFGHTVTAQFFLESGKNFKSDKDAIIKIAQSKGIDITEIMDLSIEGRGENSESIKSFIDTTNSNTKHPYKIVITKTAGAIGLDLPSISVMGIMRNIGKNNESHKIQIVGRGKRTYNGKFAENDIQDTLYLFVKEDFVFPENLKEQLESESIYYFKKNGDIIDQVNFKFDKYINIPNETKVTVLSELISADTYDFLKNKTYTVTKKYDINSHNELSGKTFTGNISDEEVNYFNSISLSDAINFRNNFKNTIQLEVHGSYEYFLQLINVSEKELTIDIKKNLKIREKLIYVLKDFRKKKKNLEKNGKIIYKIPSKYQRHSTAIKKQLYVDEVSYDRVVHMTDNNEVYFDSAAELKFFEDTVNRKGLKWIFQNPRTNQNGLSFYINEIGVMHSPDFIINYKDKILFVEITTFNKIHEKEIFMKSTNVPDNYLLVALNSKKNLVSLQKNEYSSENYHDETYWKPLNETYALF